MNIRYILLGAIALWSVFSWVLLWGQHDPIISPTTQEDSAPQPHVAYTNSFLPGQDSFSACVMFKDDMPRLVEWLAYHHHVLPLHRVIIGVDGGSRSYPLELAERYADRMQVTLWPKDVFAPDHEVFSSERKKNMDGANQFLRRQTLFLRKCALQLQQENRTWTTFIDPDEYLLFNYPAGTTPPPTAPEEFHNLVLPSVREEGIIYKFLQQHQTGQYANPCITVPRLLFGSRVEEESSRVSSQQSRLDTLRFRSHANRGDFKSNRLAKQMMDLQRFTKHQLANLKNVHTMVPGVCWNPMSVSDDKSMFKINHYLGSKEAFFHRRDDRDAYGRLDIFDAFASKNDGTDDSIAAWYDGFVATQGQQAASRLLEGAAIL